MAWFPLSASAKENLSAGLRHPLLITLVGSLVASVIIPGIVGRSNARAVRAKARIEQALEIMTTANTVNTHLQKMQTAFEAFEKEALAAGPVDYQKRGEELRSHIESIYTDFDSLAWFWTWNAFYKAQVLGLISQSDFERLQLLGSDYDKVLVATVVEFDKPRHTYFPPDGSVAKPATGPVMPGINQALHDLHTRRDEIVRKMAEVFQ